jgi:hypothetical protein
MMRLRLNSWLTVRWIHGCRTARVTWHVLDALEFWS